MAKIHQLQKVQKTSANKANTTQRAKLPIFPRLLNWFKIKNARHSCHTYDASWNAAFKMFTLLRSIAKGIKKLEVLIVSFDGNLVELRKAEDNSKARRNNNTKIVLVEEYFFVYIRDIGLYGMVRAQHQEISQKKETAGLESEIA